MRKLIIGVLCVMLGLVLVACAPNSTKGQNQGMQTETQKKPFESATVEIETFETVDTLTESEERENNELEEDPV